MNDKETYCPLTSREEAYYYALFDGVCLEKNGVSMCDLRFVMDEYRSRKEPMIQVHTRKRDKEFSQVYTSPKKALEKFTELT